MNTRYSRRKFVGGITATLALAGMRPASLAQSGSPRRGVLVDGSAYDSMARLASNENPWGPSESVLEAMTAATKYANRYRYPDGNIVETIASHHGVGADQVLLGAGSTEILHVAAAAFARDNRNVIGVEPTFGSVYAFATGFNGSAVRLPLRSDHRQDMPALVAAAKRAGAGLVYVCNPNNPTGVVVPRDEISTLLDQLPEGLPVLVDEAYHDYVEDPTYETAVVHVLKGRPVIVARTFSKIYGLAGMRLGYAIAPARLIAQMRPHTDGMGISALAKWAGVAALRDNAARDSVRARTLELRKKTVSQLEALGYSAIPSEANFFMVPLRRSVMPVIQEFSRRGVLVGRPFPPMTDHLRVSVGNAEEMDRFVAAFREILV